MEIGLKINLTMFINYFRTAFRNILRHKAYSIIIVLGLTIGVATFGLILQYVNHELSCDRFNEHFRSTYRLEHGEWALNGTAYGPEIAAQFPEIISSSRVSVWEGAAVTIKKGNDLLKLENMIYADSGFFKVFSMRFIKGNPEHSLDLPNSIVLTESTAKKIFGNEDPMNKSFMVNNKVTLTVTGIIRDVNRFHLKVNAISSFVTLMEYYDRPGFLTQHDMWNYYTYFTLKENADPDFLANKINGFYKGRHIWQEMEPDFLLRPLGDLYFTHVKIDMPQTRANRRMLLYYLLIGIIVLAIACVNFINLTIARATTRSREIGVRKVMGAKRNNLLTQFLGESIIYAFIATEFSLVLMDILQPGFNSLVQRNLSLFLLDWPWIVFLVLVLPILIGLIAGIYPAFYLTRFKPVITLKNEKTRGRGSLFFRRILIVGQFTISIVLIIATLTVHKQLGFLQNTDLGFTRENIININLNASLQKHLELFRSELLRDANIKAVSWSTQSMESITQQNSILIGEERKQYTFLGMDSEFLPLMDVKIKEGRVFQPNSPADSGKVILNEEAVNYFGLKEPVTGQFLGTGPDRYEIIGVVRNFHYNSLRSPIGPLVMALQGDWLFAANIKVNAMNFAGSIQNMKKIWNSLCPEYLFEYRFLDKSYEKLYSSELNFGKLCLYLALLAIFIASIGLLGLSSFLAEQRIKEIGVRKAMGDSTRGIIRLFSAEFLKWVLLSGIIAIPVALYIMNTWLNGFAYRVKVDGYILAGSCLIAMLIALCTVMGQTYKIASRNPVEALRYE